MKFAIADPPYLGRAKRWYGVGGCGDGHGKNQADNHPNAEIWDDPKTHIELARKLNAEYDGFAIALSVHSLSTYLHELQTDSRNGIRVGSWLKPSAITSGSRVTNHWEPVIFKIPQERRGWKTGATVKDVLICNPLKTGFRGAKPPEWVSWVLEIMGVQETDEVDDLFLGSGAVTNALKIQRLTV